MKALFASLPNQIQHWCKQRDLPVKVWLDYSARRHNIQQHKLTGASYAG